MLAIEQLALALALVLGGGILMLLLGTQVLHWYWLLLLGGAGLSIAFFRVRARMLNRYRVAQILDRKLDLRDSLSTAWFLLSEPGRDADPIARYQIECAGKLAASVQPVRVFPFIGQRLWLLTGGLAAVAFGLFAVRYLVTSSLSIEQALIPIHFGEVMERIEKSLVAEDRPASDRPAFEPQIHQPKDPADSKESERQSKEASGDPPATISEATGSDGRGQSHKLGGYELREAKDGESKTGETRESKANPLQNTEPGQESSKSAGDRQSASPKEQNAGDQQPSPGLMDKMRDALSSLMAKMRPASVPQRGSGREDRSAQNQNAPDQKASSKDKSQESQQNAGNEQGSQDQNSEGQGQGETTERVGASQGRNSEQWADKKSSEAQSGVGRQDGDKSIQSAEELKAMGKLSEIIGKRAASLSGDMTVEMPSGKQSLKTDYSQRIGRHAGLGGAISRDEVPLEYRQYVLEYMEQVHKQSKHP